MYENNFEMLKKAKEGDENAKEQLLKNNFPLIKSVIRRFKNRGIEYEDLYQLGCVGFVRAINNFDLSYNVKFSTYAVPMIAGEVKRFLRDDGIIKVSRSIKHQAKLINNFIQETVLQTGKTPSIDEIAKNFNIDAPEVVLVMESIRAPISISQKLDEDEESTEIGDIITSDKDSDEKLINKITIKEILSKLNERDRKIILLRYYMDKTQNEIAKMLGVSQVQISRIENKIIEDIKNNMVK